MRTPLSWSLWALGQALRLPLEGGWPPSERAILAQLGTGLLPSLVWLMPFSPPSPLCSRVHTLGNGIHEACSPESRKTVRADLANTSVGELHSIGSGQLLGCWQATLSCLVSPGPQTPATMAPRALGAGTGVCSRAATLGRLSAPVTYWIAAGVLCFTYRSDIVSAFLFHSRGTCELGTLCFQGGKLVPWG